MKLHASTYLLVLSVLFCSPVSFANEVNLLPESLRKIAKENQCSQISDFYDRPGPIDPTYVWGYPTPDQDSGAVFWCKKASKDDNYLLVIWDREKIGPTCPSTIEWLNYPGGLSIIYDKRIPLSKFRYWGNPKKTGPPNVYTSGPIIHNEYDGVGSEYYCHEGQWLFRQFH